MNRFALLTVLVVVFVAIVLGTAHAQDSNTYLPLVAGLPPAPLGEIAVPAGTFQMGCDWHTELCIYYDDEKPLHTVYLDDYYIDKYEVTNTRYAVCVNAARARRHIVSGLSRVSSTSTTPRTPPTR